MKRSIVALLALAGPVSSQAQTVENWIKAFQIDAERVVLGLQVWQWVGLLGLAVASVAAAILGWLVASLIIKLRFRLAPSDLSEDVRRGIRRSSGLIAAGWMWEGGIDSLALREIGTFTAFAATLVVVGAVWLAVSLWDGFCDSLIRKAADVSRKAERILIPILRKVVRAVIMVGGAMIGLWWLGANVAGIVAGLGIGGVAVALAAKDSVENVFGSMTILFDMPFAIGDWIRVGDVYGKVEEINLRSTRIRLATGALVTLPNSNLIRAAVENVGDLTRRRILITLPVALDTPPHRIKEFCVAARDRLAEIPTMDEETIRVAPTDVQSSGLVITVFCWLDAETWDLELEARESIIEALLELTDQTKVVLQGVPRWGPPAP